MSWTMCPSRITSCLEARPAKSSFVRHHDDRDPALADQHLEDIHHDETVPRVEIARRFVRKHLRLKDAKGLQYIAHLLRHEGREFHAADLAAGVEAGPQPDPASGGEATEIVAGLGDAGERLDAPARAAYRQRLQDLEAELAEATQWADTGRAEQLRAEVEFLRVELAAAYGLGGRVRRAADASDRARKAVTSRIRESIERIGKEHPALARHLQNAIHTGTFCSYQPDRPLPWKL
jgi:hypothetical protein